MTDAPDTLRNDEPEAYCPACGQSFSPDIERCPTDRAVLVRLRGKRDPLIGRIFEQRYEIRSQLGEGGMGTVYRGWQVSVDREVAIKVIDPKLSSNRDIVKRFLREARLSSRLQQPSIVNVYDFGQTEDGILYIVMELLRGHTLARELELQRVFGLERTINIGMQLCDALEAAHKLGIIHRDLKPGNVVILDEPPGRDLVKVLDFGLAKSLVSDAISKVTLSDAMLGTPLYMSPEQIQGHPSDQRADLYSLGCMLHEMLSGTPPFGDKTVDRVLSNHIYELAAPLPPDVPPPVADLILRLIAKHPDERPSSAAEVRESLAAQLGQTSTLGIRERRSAASSPVAHAATSPSVASDARPSRRRGLLVLGALLAVAAITTAVVLGLQRRVPAVPSAVPPATSDAAGRAVDADSVTAIDAGTAVLDAAAPRPPKDARPPRVQVDVGRPIVRPPIPSPPDAAVDLEFYRRDAAR